MVVAIGKDKYYAVLKDLPTLVESHKTVDNESFYKIADVGQVLEVSSVKESEGHRRPHFDEINNGLFSQQSSSEKKQRKKKRKLDDAMDDSGLTPPMYQIRHTFSKLDDDSGIDPKDVKRLDSLFVELEAEVNKRERSAEEAAKPFVYEELVDEEPFMEYWDDVTVLDQGNNDFISSARKAYDAAYERYLQKHPGMKQQEGQTGETGQSKDVEQKAAQMPFSQTQQKSSGQAGAKPPGSA